MSFICGVMNRKGFSVSNSYAEKMMSTADFYAYGRSDFLIENHIFLGCRNTFITPESRNEILPYKDESSGLLITADAIIDNRKELLDLFEIPYVERNLITDSQIILMAYKKWEHKCPLYLFGDYTFVIYNINSGNIFCARDHMGKRAFYYYLSEEIFAFSTTINPLLSLGIFEKQINESWMANFLSLLSPLHEVNCKETVYKNVLQLEPANTMIVSDSNQRIDRFWFPYNKSKIKLGSDVEYEEALREVFFEAVKCRLRVDGEIGIMLSGGLDSGSVACVAASQLMQSGKRLKAYSYIPFDDYKDDLPPDLIADESDYIKKIVNKYSNIDLHLSSFADKTPISDIDSLINILEQPYKAVHNLYWINSITTKAYFSGCKIILDGQVGNSTISFGSNTMHFTTLLNQLKLIKLYKDIKRFCEIYKFSYGEFLKVFVYGLLPDKMINVYRIFKGSYEKKEIPVPVNLEIAAKYDSFKTLKKLGIYPSSKTNEINRLRKKLLQQQELTQIGMIETKLSLNNGPQIRDPSGDKRVVEFCFSLPEDQYSKNLMNRSLIRRAMKDILPDEVRMNLSVRGRQGADWVQRIQKQWASISDELNTLNKEDIYCHYINIDLVNDFLKRIDSNPNDKFNNEIYVLLISLITGRFLKSEIL